MSRHRNLQVDLPEPKLNDRGAKIFGWDTIKVAALYDLRDELQEQNRLQREILYTLKRMDRRAAKAFPLKAR